MPETKIEWADHVWNFLLGCDKYSPGCLNCYAVMQAHRNWLMALALPADRRGRLAYYEGLTRKDEAGRVHWTGKIAFVEEALEIPLKRQIPTQYFVDSMSDAFHVKVEDQWLDRAFAVMALTERHRYLLLTKRVERARDYLRGGAKQRIRRAAVELGRARGLDVEAIASCQWDWPLPNVWLGASVEDQDAADRRVPVLLETPAAVRWLSVEPMLGPVNLRQHLAHSYRCPELPPPGEVGFPSGKCYCPQLHWVVCGGESQQGREIARVFDVGWARDLLTQSREAGIAFFLKQLGSRPIMEVPPGYVPNFEELEAPNPDKTLIKIKTVDRKGGKFDQWPAALDDLKVREVI